MLSSIFVVLGNLYLSDTDIFDFPYEVVVLYATMIYLHEKDTSCKEIRRRQQLLNQLVYVQW